MSDILLPAKPELSEGTLDCSVGEPHIVRDALARHFDLSFNNMYNPSRWAEYPSSCGYKPLVALLEEKYQAPVVVTNGAKQALGACFYALNKMGKASCAMRAPYWALIPPLASMHGLQSQFVEGDNVTPESVESYLCLAPNNPDGFVPAKLKEMSEFYRQRNIPFVHDAAYYTHTYLPLDYKLESLGDVQIYSISKMLGLSGLRLGFAVCHNPIMYQHIKSYMEAMTVGVSIMPQIYLYNLLDCMKHDPSQTDKFEDESFVALQKAKKIFAKISSEVLELPSNLDSVPGMFLWAKTTNKTDLKKSKVHAADGSYFGSPGMIRLNMAFNEDIAKDIVNRINGVLSGT